MSKTIEFEKHISQNDFLSSKRSKRIIKVYYDGEKYYILRMLDIQKRLLRLSVEKCWSFKG